MITAYAFAQNEKLNEKNLLLAHKTLSKQLLITSLRGKYRQEKVGVFGASGLIYLALEEELVPQQMKDFFKEIEFILSNKVTLSEAFYFASLIH